MKKRPAAQHSGTSLRKIAEKITEADSAETVASLTSEQLQKTLHELRVHQIELEIQNEELRRVQEELEVSRARYFDLYDLAPIGYCTLSEKNLIRDANLTIGDMLGRTRTALIRQPFSRFILPEDQDIFYLLRKKPLQNGVSHTGELRLLKKDGTPFWVHLVLSAYRITDGEPGIRVVVSDINERKQLEDARTFLLRCGYPGSKEGFFEALARYLAKNLQVDHVYIDRLSEDLLTAHTVAIYHNDHFAANTSYTLTDTPCGEVVGNDIRCFPANVCRSFPNDAVLRELKAESYAGTTLWGYNGKPIGLIAVIGRAPMVNRVLTESILRMVALRAAGELERKKHENDLLIVNDCLEHQRIKLQAIVENVLEGIILCHLDGRLEQWNPAARAMHGFIDEKACAGDLSEFASMFESRNSRGDILSPDALPIARVIRGEQLSGEEIHLRRLNRDCMKILSYHGQIVCNTDGEKLWAVVMIRDITRFKQAEAAINDIALFPEQNPTPVLRISSNGLLLYSNPASRKFREQWSFKSGACVPPEWRDIVLRSITTGERLKKEAVTGSRIFEFIFVPLVHFNYVNVYASDITDRTHAEVGLKQVKDGLEIQVQQRTTDLLSAMEKLTIERQRFNDVLEMLPAYIVLLTPDYKVKFANRFFNERFGTSTDDQCLRHLFNGAPSSGSFNLFKSLENAAPPVRECTGPDNRNYEIHDFPFTDTDGSPLIMEMGIDVTDRKKAEAALIEANEMKLLGQLTAGVAHEVRNPLNGIMSIMGALSKELADDDRFDPFVQHLRSQVTRLTVLMEDLLTIGRPLHEGNIMELSMVSLVEKAIATWLQTVQFPKPQLQVIKPDAAQGCLIRGDSTSLMQMFINLLENALEHSGAEAEIVCSVHENTSGGIVFSVRDSGSGIPAEILPKIFDPFFTTRKGGTGLGLSIVRRIVDNHQGTITAFNNSDGPGATFEAVFPLSRI
ncbi:MAG: PAS domain S-box protein [Chitinispirillaceae bacterium]|nr:PAS domain S-box protein [Chitinispirillaceae bacterium]